MYKILAVYVSCLISLSTYAQQGTVIVDPNTVNLHSYVHQSLSPDLLKRIKKTTDIFEAVDGISYEQAVDLYKRDLDPEANLIIFEEMARIYKKFCSSRCSNPKKKKDVYTLLLLRSMFSTSEAIARFKPVTLTKQEIIDITKQYKLVAQPISVIVE